MESSPCRALAGTHDGGGRSHRQCCLLWGRALDRSLGGMCLLIIWKQEQNMMGCERASSSVHPAYQRDEEMESQGRWATCQVPQLIGVRGWSRTHLSHLAHSRLFHSVSWILQSFKSCAVGHGIPSKYRSDWYWPRWFFIIWFAFHWCYLDIRIQHKPLCGHLFCV